MSAFGCVVCGEPIQGLSDTCSEECELLEDAARCPECGASTEPFAWSTGRPRHHGPHADACSRTDVPLRAANG
jgi:hypothetical protein